MRDDVSVNTLHVFDTPDDRSDQAEDAHDVQANHMLEPRSAAGARCRIARQAVMEDGRRGDEEAKVRDLEEQATDDDVIGSVDLGRVLGGQHARAVGYDDETGEISQDEDFREPGASDEESLLPIDHDDDAS